MTAAPAFLPETSALPAAELRPYPLELRASDDYQQLSELAAEMGYRAKDLVWVAIDQMALYRQAMHFYRAALVELGALRELPELADVVTSI